MLMACTCVASPVGQQCLESVMNECRLESREILRAACMASVCAVMLGSWVQVCGGNAGNLMGAAALYNGDWEKGVQPCCFILLLISFHVRIQQC